MHGLRADRIRPLDHLADGSLLRPGIPAQLDFLIRSIHPAMRALREARGYPRSFGQIVPVKVTGPDGPGSISSMKVCALTRCWKG
jgi:hypothetical protein